MTLIPETPPAHVCLLRLSAIGDTCHALFVLRALQAAWPKTEVTWIIGKLEARLMVPLLPEVEFIIFDKRASFTEWLRVRSLLATRRFDLLLHMQLALRASLMSTLVHAPIRLGFDRARARELQWLFCNKHIVPASREHVLDSLLGFVRACGIEPGRPQARLTLPADALDYGLEVAPDDRPTLLISPCSSRPVRNWLADRYAAVASHAVRRHGMRVVLVGGPSQTERLMGEAIASGTDVSLVNQIGRDTLPRLLGLIQRATVLLTPDSGPAHMATLVGTPVIGLYAATNPARSGPYGSLELCVDRYEAACLKLRGKPSTALPWTEKIEEPGVMDLIEVQAVTERLDEVMRRRGFG